MLRCPRLFALNYIRYEHSDQKEQAATRLPALFGTGDKQLAPASSLLHTKHFETRNTHARPKIDSVGL